METFFLGFTAFLWAWDVYYKQFFWIVLVDCPSSSPSVSSFECVLQNYYDCHLCPDQQWPNFISCLNLDQNVCGVHITSIGSPCVFFIYSHTYVHTYIPIHPRLKLLGQSQVSALLCHLKWDSSILKGLLHLPFGNAWQVGSCLLYTSDAADEHRDV